MIIRNGSITRDDWTLLRPGEHDNPADVVVPEGKLIVPLKVWKAQRDTLQSRTEFGVWLASDERAEELKDDLAMFPVIAVDFPKFADGRGYSIAVQLRTRLGYTGELRAIGDVLRDQMFYMQRAGFDAFVLRPDKDIAAALQGLNDFTITYQASADERLPLFRRVQRGSTS